MVARASHIYLTKFLPAGGGNGSVDCTAALQNAVDEAVNGGAGGKVICPAGYYPIGTILMPSTGTGAARVDYNITIEGEGKQIGFNATPGPGNTSGGVTVFAGNGSSLPMFRLSNDEFITGTGPTSGVKFRNLVIAKGSNTGPAIRGNAFLGGGFYYVTFHGWGVGGVDIRAESFWAHIVGSDFYNTQLRIGERINGVNIDKCSFGQSSFSEPVIDIGADNNSGTGVHVTNSYFEKLDGPAIKTNLHHSLNILHNYFEKQHENAGGLQAAIHVVGWGSPHTTVVNLMQNYWFNSAGSGRALIYAENRVLLNAIGNQIAPGGTAYIADFANPTEAIGNFIGNGHVAGTDVRLLRSAAPSRSPADGSAAFTFFGNDCAVS